MAFNKENKITWEELAPSLQELFKGLQTQITNEYERATREEQRIEGRLNYEILRATKREDWLEADYNKLINQIWGSDGRKYPEHDITAIWAAIEELEEKNDPDTPGNSSGISSGPGYIKFSNGVILQWGFWQYHGDGSYQSFSWNINYTQRCFGLWCMHSGTDPVAYNIYGGTLSTSGVTIRGTGIFGDIREVGWVPPDDWDTWWISLGL